MQSKMYRYNSRWVEILIDYVHPISNARSDGFEPLRGTMDKMKIRTGTEEESVEQYYYDPVKLDYLGKLVEEASGSKLLFVVSPIWYGMDSRQFEPVIRLCQEKGIPFYDFSNDPKYVHCDEYFKDGNHMNERGADEFTRDLMKYLRKEILQ